MNKKEKKKREKRMAGFMTSKSTAELAEEMKKVIEQDIPDPRPDELPHWLRQAPFDARANEEDLIDTVDTQERSKPGHEGTERGQ